MEWCASHDDGEVQAVFVTPIHLSNFAANLLLPNPCGVRPQLAGGLKARDVTARVGASIASGGPGNA
jgi:hypothetical protein